MRVPLLRVVAAAVAVSVLIGDAAAVGLQDAGSPEDAGSLEDVESFEDAGSGVHAPAIEALQGLGVFEGTECGEDLFCPGEPVLRWEMAVWLARVLIEVELSAGLLEVSESRFEDVEAGAWWIPHVEMLAASGITTGCRTDPPRFCPDDPVTRAQTASFLSRALALEKVDGIGTFVDVEGGVHAANIEALAASGITVGCRTDPPRFCPGRETTRAQMATFLKRAYVRVVGACPTEAQPDGDDGDDGDEGDDGGGGGGGFGGGGGGGGGGGFGGGGGGGGGGFDGVTATTVPPAGRPQSVTAAPDDGSLTIAWKAPELELELHGYRLRWKGPGQAYETDGERLGYTTGTSYEITGLQNGMRYHVQVAAVFPAEQFGEWAEVSAVPSTVPDSPLRVEAASGDEQLTVSWQAPSQLGIAAITGYRVQWRSGGQPYHSSRQQEVAASARRAVVSNLTNGTEHFVRVAAVNPVGASAWPEEVAGTPAGPPGQPQSVSATGGDRQLTVRWRAPSSDGGSPVTGYRVQWRRGGQSYHPSRQREVAAGVTQAVVSNLTNGSEYAVRVLALNAKGAGDPAPASATPAGVAGPPRSLDLERGAGSIKVRWRAPSSDGGSPVTGYWVQWRAESEEMEVGASDDLVYDMRGLENGTRYFVQVVAENAAGRGEPSQERSATPATTPLAPADVDADRGDGSVTVSWAAADGRGADVTGYRLQWRAGDGSFDVADSSVGLGGGASSHQIRGLDNGTKYFVRVRATNEVGDSEWSSSESATPAGVAGPPRSLDLERGDGSIKVSWRAPSSDGGSAVTDYLVQWRAESEGYASGGEMEVGASDDLVYDIPNLDNGTRYFVRVVAQNAVGRGEPSQERSATPATTPLAPTDVDADRGDRSVTVSWAAADGQGADVTGYRLQWRAGDASFDVADSSAGLGGGASSHQIRGLDNGTEYFVRVRATNEVGHSEWSSPASATPATRPAAPGGLALERGDGSINVSWQAADGRGSPVTGYDLQWSDDGFSQSIDTYDAAAQARTRRIGDLVNGTAYSVRVRAINAVDAGPWSSASAVPAALPGEPGDVTIEVKVAALGVSWTPADPGGLRITGYRVQWSAGDASFDDSDSYVDLDRPVSSRQIRGLTNGTEYFVRVRATNEVGDGTWSPAESAVPVELPGEPGNVVAEPRPWALAVSWEQPDDGGAVDSYRVQWASGDQEYSSDRRATLGASATSHTIDGLNNGTEYRVRVAAVNAVRATSAPVVRATPRTVPGPPRALDVRSVSDTLMLSWDPPAADGGSAVTGYRVQWRSATQEYDETDRQAEPTAPRHVIVKLTKGTEYVVRVAAVNAAGAGAALEGSITLDDPPNAPRSPGATVRNRSLEVFWSAPADGGATPITEYRVFWKGPDDASFDESVCSLRRITVLAGTPLEGAIGPLDNATAYDIRIVAVNDSGPSDPATLTATPAAVPGKPVGLAVYAFADGLQLLWNKPSDNGSAITGYRVQWKSGDQQYSRDRQATPGASAESHTIEGLSKGTEYTTRTVAVNANGDSRVAEATGTPADTPGKPTGFSSTGYLNCQRPTLHLCNIYGPWEYVVEVTWSAPEAGGASAVTEYRVDWREGWSTGEYSMKTVPVGRIEITVNCFGGSRVCERRWLDLRVSAVNDRGAGPAAEYDADLRVE